MVETLGVPEMVRRAVKGIPGASQPEQRWDVKVSYSEMAVVEEEGKALDIQVGMSLCQFPVELSQKRSSWAG
jgi:hypothetical protein